MLTADIANLLSSISGLKFHFISRKDNIFDIGYVHQFYNMHKCHYGKLVEDGNLELLKVCIYKSYNNLDFIRTNTHAVLRAQYFNIIKWFNQFKPIMYIDYVCNNLPLANWLYKNSNYSTDIDLLEVHNSGTLDWLSDRFVLNIDTIHYHNNSCLVWFIDNKYCNREMFDSIAKLSTVEVFEYALQKTEHKVSQDNIYDSATNVDTNILEYICINKLIEPVDIDDLIIDNLFEQIKIIHKHVKVTCSEGGFILAFENSYFDIVDWLIVNLHFSKAILSTFQNLSNAQINYLL